MNKQFNFYQVRDLGQNLEMAFKFFTTNFSRFGLVVCLTLPLILIGAILTPNPAELQASIDPTDMSSIMGVYMSTLLVSLFQFAATLIINTYVVVFLKIYVDSPDGVVTKEAVKEALKKFILPILGGQILLSCLIFIGTCLCILPGIFVAISCGFYLFVIANEQYTVSGGLVRSYELVKNNWWITFGYGLVVVLGVGIVSSIISVPLGLVAMAMSLDPIFIIIINFITTSLTVLLSSFACVAFGVYYYHLRTLKGDGGTYFQDDIDKLGNDSYNNY